MNAETFLSNLLSWAMQVFVVTCAGAILPLLFRIQHPRSYLAYCQALLLSSLLLPLVQPWQRPTIFIAAETREAIPVATPLESSISGVMTIPWESIVMMILLAGIAIRLTWIGAGLWQIRRYRANAVPLHTLPDSIAAAREMVKADAAFCISKGAVGPATFGAVHPVVLLPGSFLELDREAQCGIACHELLHVRRKDWLITVFEEVVGALLWFHPAIWWLLSQTRLAREQLVDAEVVRLTTSREPYINALLAIAGANQVHLAPAPLLLRRRHLAQRLHSLVMEVPMSKFRLLSSYVSMVVILAIAGWFALVSFPLAGEAEIRHAPPSQQTVGYVVHKRPLFYPPAARQKRVEGTVVVEVSVNSRGEVIDTRVISGPDELRQSALQTALQGTYPTEVARSLQVIVDFKLPAVSNAIPPPPPPPPPPPSPGNATLAGTVADATGTLIADAAITLRNSETGTASRIRTDANGAYRFASLLPGTYALTAEKSGFQNRTYHNVQIGISQQVQLNFRLEPGSSQHEAHAALHTAARDARIGLEEIASQHEAHAALHTAASGTDGSVGGQRVRVGGNVQSTNLLHQVPPIYPPLAKQARIQGVVVLEAQISMQGQVDDLKVVVGHPLLIQAAVDAVKQWVYKPTLLNGQPVEVVTTVTVNFALRDELQQD